MFLSNFMNYLTQHIPVSRWILIIILFGCAAGVAYLIKESIDKQMKGD